MDSKAIRTPEGARDILEYNINLLYHLPKKYKCLDRALRDVRGEMFKLLQFCKSKDPIIWKQKYVWFVERNRMKAIMNVGTVRSANKKFNYLCCLGILEKVKQSEDDMIGVNMMFLLDYKDKGRKVNRPINTFAVHRYTEKKLDEIEKRAAKILEHKITPGNISNDKLKASDCGDLAAEVYYANSEKSIENKTRAYKQITDLIDQLCEEKGYTDKDELCLIMGWKREYLDRILTVFKETWLQQYKYKAPTKAEVEKYKLQSKSWIIKRG
ncbi:MAG: hypothetical protein IKW21_04325 [Lachnospiraceae bacterium]|nr:hypothetical protein [Lachnospiraceae bacterium]